MGIAVITLCVVEAVQLAPNPPEYEVAFDKGENAFMHATEGIVRRTGYVTIFNDRIGAEQVG